MADHLPFEPELIADLRQRWPVMLAAPPFDLMNVVAAGPGSQRRHVFDTHDGIRLISGIDLFDQQRLLHVRCSCTDQVLRQFFTRTALAERFDQVLREISGQGLAERTLVDCAYDQAWHYWFVLE